MAAASQTRANGYIDESQVIYLLAKFENRKKVRQTARRLVENGLIWEVRENCWTITRAGEDALYEMASRPASKNGSRPSRYQLHA